MAQPFHALLEAELLARLQVEPREGLTSDERARRLAMTGPNRLAATPPVPAWKKYARQFDSLLVWVLVAAAALAAAVGDIKDAIAIGVVLLFNTWLGFVQERRAEAALQALSQMLSRRARIMLQGATVEVAAESLVPGDVLLLEAGDHVPADARVIQAFSVEANEATLTGESVGVEKREGVAPPEAAVFERFNMVFMNTIVTRGRLVAVVVATGMASEMGRVAGLLGTTTEPETPLQRQLDQLGKRLALIAVAVAGAMVLVSALRGDSLVAAALSSMALAVAAIPEGLPAVVTVTLALGMHRMAQRRAIPKKLASVETLGCASLILSDKTGTLTRNEMTVREVVYRDAVLQVSGEGYAGAGEIASQTAPRPDLGILAQCAMGCVDARLEGDTLIGDPTEGALLALARKAGAAVPAGAVPRLGEIPFDAAHRYMMTAYTEGDAVRLWLKGAPEAVWPRCSHALADHDEAALDDGLRAALSAHPHRMAGQAMRVLALATRVVSRGEFDRAPAGHALVDLVEDLTFVAWVGMIDPPRHEVPGAIERAQQAGVAVKMITGDHLATGRAVATQLGLKGEAHEGREIEGLSQPELAALVRRSAVFARVSPSQKLAIVEAMRAAGEVVAVTGDGVNDAPALKAADIGVAMGKNGTEVARQAASLVLADDNFATIVAAIEQGRLIFENILKFVRFQIATNLAAIFTVLGALLLGWPMPFTAIQILWVNLIVDGPPAITLALEPAREGVMREPPRARGGAVLTAKRLRGLMKAALLMALGTLAALAWGTRIGGAHYGQTLAFTTFVAFQLFNILNVRAGDASVFQRRFLGNGWLWGALATVAACQVLVVEVPWLQGWFDTTGLDLAGGVVAVTIASSVLWLREGQKWLQWRKKPNKGK